MSVAHQEKWGEMGTYKALQTRNLCSLPAVLTAHHSLFSGLHEQGSHFCVAQGSHFCVAQLRSTRQRKQAVGESVMWEGELNLGLAPEAVAH